MFWNNVYAGKEATIDTLNKETNEKLSQWIEKNKITPKYELLKKSAIIGKIVSKIVEPQMRALTQLPNLTTLAVRIAGTDKIVAINVDGNIREDMKDIRITNIFTRRTAGVLYYMTTIENIIPLEVNQSNSKEFKAMATSAVRGHYQETNKGE